MNEHDFLLSVGGRPTVLAGADPDKPESIVWNFGVQPETAASLSLFQAKLPLYAALPHIKGRWDGTSTINHWEAVRRFLGESKVESLIQLQPRGTCFPAGTPVTMADGTTRPIETVGVGMEVLSHTGQPARVVRIMQRHAPGELIQLSSEDGDRVTTTPDHPFLVRDTEAKTSDQEFRWLDANQITAEHQLVRIVKNPSDGAITMSKVSAGITGAESDTGTLVYNLETENEHSYIAANLAVHNCGGRAGSLTGDLVQCILGAAGKQRFTFQRVSHASLYFLARKLYDMLNGSWQDDNNDGVASGSIPEAMKRFGVCNRDEIGDRKYYGEGSDDLACQLGAGMLPELQKKILQLAGDNLITDWYPVRSAQELADGIAAGGIGLGSDGQGFTMTRDSDGFCSPSGTWQHYQVRASVGVYNGRKGFGYAQSWGVNVPDGPLLPGHPSNCFGVDFNVQDRIVRSGRWVVVFGWVPWDLQNEPTLIDWIFP